MLFRACTISLIAYWIGVGFIFLRRGDAVTPMDRWYVRWGWVAIVAVSIPVALCCWRSVGAIR